MLHKFFSGKYEHFKAIFRPATLIDSFEKVKWLKHKTSLREFFLILEITPTQRILKELISDKNGQEIVLAKPKRKEYSTCFQEMETIIDPIKNRP